jgi:hypothetical protein
MVPPHSYSAEAHPPVTNAGGLQAHTVQHDTQLAGRTPVLTHAARSLMAASSSDTGKVQ